ncbi:c-type cytochrome [Tepidamorphus sp. 3E244]|uniref:c-type cytochrome n=1 Tax=Tepidamorphus sp. 3E244 TaxID=3385498 RepID=UPI0038FC4C23
MIRNLTLLATAGILAGGIAAAAASDDPIADRQMMMKNTGAAIGTLAKMAKGEMEFDATAANLAVRTMNNAAIGFVHLFPEDSMEGGDTEAGPKIWEDMAGFVEKARAMETVTADAIAFPAESLDDVKEQLGKIGGTCKACHDDYRVKKS